MCVPYFARGLFTSAPVVAMGTTRGVAAGVASVLGPVCVLLDPLARTLLRGTCGTGATRAVRPSDDTCDAELGDALWRASCARCGMPESMAI